MFEEFVMSEEYLLLRIVDTNRIPAKEANKNIAFIADSDNVRRFQVHRLFLRAPGQGLAAASNRAHNKRTKSVKCHIKS